MINLISHKYRKANTVSLGTFGGENKSVWTILNTQTNSGETDYTAGVVSMDILIPAVAVKLGCVGIYSNCCKAKQTAATVLQKGEGYNLFRVTFNFKGSKCLILKTQASGGSDYILTFESRYFSSGTPLPLFAFSLCLCEQYLTPLPFLREKLNHASFQSYTIFANEMKIFWFLI